VRELAPPVVRYPGGNFVSAYNWEDGVGPRESRPRRLDFAWKTSESNQVGTNEFVDWCRRVGAAPLMAVNLGTRGLEAARRLLEYCNHPGGSELSDLRATHGFREPHKIRTWCLGNEMDSPWQTGHKTQDEYGRLAAETARAMRQFDPDLELVACGASGPSLPTFPEWDRVVLEHAYEQVDYISAHLYVNDTNRTPEEFLATSRIMENQLQTLTGLCAVMQTRKRSEKRMMICFDEWNVWDHSRYLNPEGFREWQEAPAQLEQPYRLIDTIVFGSLLITLLKNAARVRIACVAQLVNVIAPIMTEPGGSSWKQGTYFPLLHGSRFGRGELVSLQVQSPDYETREFGRVPYIEAVATRNPESGEVTIFAINRHLAESIELQAQLLGATGYQLKEHITVSGDEPECVNTADRPDAIKPEIQEESSVKDGRFLSASLKPLSWNVLRLEPA
jgi:alpha-N-arabinofuranosidase